jgi:hypothetical protein
MMRVAERQGERPGHGMAEERLAAKRHGAGDARNPRGSIHRFTPIYTDSMHAPESVGICANLWITLFLWNLLVAARNARIAVHRWRMAPGCGDGVTAVPPSSTSRCRIGRSEWAELWGGRLQG